MIVVNFGKKI